MKRAIFLLWKGLTGILAGIAEWFTVILGMKDDSKYGRIIRRVVGGSFALIMAVMAVAIVYAVGKAFYEELPRHVRYGDDYFDQQYISRNVTYYSKDYWAEDGYIKTNDGTKTITGIRWIAKPLGHDSLICYSDGKKRGYFNMYTGETVIKPQYAHAWIFSEGLAAVDEGGWIKFINASGKVVIDPKVPYIIGSQGYLFHNGYCVIHGDRRETVGLMDKHGKWVLKPEYFSIEAEDSAWVVDNGKEQAVLDLNLKPVIPFMKGNMVVYRTGITVTMPDHSIRKYTLKGELINDFYINNVEMLTYDTEELYIGKTPTYDEEGNITGEVESAEPSFKKAIARNRIYEAEADWYGLMSPDGKIITPPSYTSIQAIGPNLYLCKDGSYNGIILNGKGEQVK